MQICPNCNRVYDPTQDSRCPYCTKDCPNCGGIMYWDFDRIWKCTNCSIEIYTDDYGNEYEGQEDYLRSLKKEDYYHFTIPFEYIKKNFGNNNYDIGIAQMEVYVNWNDVCCGYSITHNCPDMYKIDPNEGNGDENDFYDNSVEDIVFEKLEELGIGVISLV